MLVSNQSSTHCSRRSRRSTLDQVTLLTQDIEDSFRLKRPELCLSMSQQPTHYMAPRLICKLLLLLPDRHMVRIIMGMVGNRSFTLTTENGKRKTLRCIKNGFPQEFFLASLSPQHLHV